MELVRESFAGAGPPGRRTSSSDSRFDFPFLTAIRPGAVLFAPTLVRGEAVGGIFLVWWRSGRAFDPPEIRLVEGVASQVGLAVENAELARQTAEKLDEMERLLNVSRALSSTIELGPLLRTLLRQVTRTTGADTAGVWLADAATGALEPFAGYHVPPDILERLRGFRIDPARSPLYAEAIARRAAVIARDARSDEGLPAGSVTIAPHRAQLFAPIVANERLVGALIAVWWERELACGDRELGLVDAMASQAGIALENARLVRGRPAQARRAVRALRAVAGRHGTAGHGPARRGRPPRGGAGARRPQPGRLPLRPRPPRAGGRPAGVGRDARRRTFRAAVRSASGWRAPSSRGARRCARPTTPRRARGRASTPVPESLALPHWLGVPMVVGDEVLGALTLCGGRPSVHGGRRAPADQHREPDGAGAPQRPALRGALGGVPGAHPGPGPHGPDREAARARRDGGRRGPRLQQPAGRHRRPCRAPAAPRARAGARPRPRDDPSGGPGRRPDGPAHPGVHPDAPDPAVPPGGPAGRRSGRSSR